jgi:uncharacterized protein (UPF0210 family)
MADAVHNAVEKGADKAAAIGNVARSYGVSIWTVRAALQVHPAEAKAEKKSRRKAS